MPNKGFALLSHFSSGPNIGKERKRNGIKYKRWSTFDMQGGIMVSLTWTSRLKVTVAQNYRSASFRVNGTPVERVE